MKNENDDILELLPQRPPIVMVDSFDGMEDTRSYTTLTVRRDNLFFNGDALDEAGLIEHMAQSAAARAGYLARMNNEPVRLGFIGSVDKFVLHRRPVEGEVLHTEVDLLQQVVGVSLIHVSVRVNEEEIAHGNMKIVLQ